MKMSRIKWTMMIIIAAVCMAYLIPGILIRAEDYRNINIVKKGILSSDEIVPSHAFYLSMSEKVMVLNQMLKGKGKEMKQTTLDLEQNYVESLTWKALSSLYDYKWVPDLTSFYDTKMETKLYYCKIRPGSSSVVGHVYEMIITNPKYGSKITVYADARDGMILYLKAEGAADWLNSAERFHNDIFNGTNFSSADSVMPLTLQEEMISALNRLTYVSARM